MKKPVQQCIGEAKEEVDNNNDTRMTTTMKTRWIKDDEDDEDAKDKKDHQDNEYNKDKEEEEELFLQKCIKWQNIPACQIWWG